MNEHIKSKHRKKVSRSIEEIILQRQLDARNPLSWPDVTDRPSTSIVTPVNRTRPTTSSMALTLKSLSGKSDPFPEERRMIKPLSPSIFGRSNLMATATIRDSHDDAMTNALKDYCDALERRVQELESTVISLQQVIASNGTDLKRVNRQWMMTMTDPSMSNSMAMTNALEASGSSQEMTNTNNNTNNSMSMTKLPSNVNFRESISSIDQKVLHLKDLFKRGDPFEQRRIAATKIACLIRGFLARRRYESYFHGVQEWKWSRCKMVMWLLDSLLNNQTKLDLGLQRLQLRRQMKLLYIVFNKWNFIRRQNAPLKRAILQRTEELFEKKQQLLLARSFNGLKETCIGHQSLRKLRQERKILLEKIKSELREKYRKRGDGIIVLNEEEIQLELYRHIVQTFHSQKQKRFLIRILNALKNCVKQRQSFEKLSMKRWFSKCVRPCFIAWSDYTYLIGSGLERKRWPGPRKYEIRYNQKRIDNFARLRLLKYVFLP